MLMVASITPITERNTPHKNTLNDLQSSAYYRAWGKKATHMTTRLQRASSKHSNTKKSILMNMKHSKKQKKTSKTLLKRYTTKKGYIPVLGMSHRQNLKTNI